MTLKELIKDKELPVRVCYKTDHYVDNVKYIEFRYVIKNTAFGHFAYKDKSGYYSTSWSLDVEHFKLYEEPTKKKIITLKKYQIVYKNYNDHYSSTQYWFENEAHVKRWFNTAIKIQYLEGHDIEV